MAKQVIGGTPNKWPLVDYFLVLGGGGDGEAPQPLQPLRRTSRSDSTIIQPIRDLVVVESANLKDVPRGYQRIPVLSDKKDQTFKNWLCETRFLGRSLPGSPNEDDPITDIDIIFTDKKETPKKGFTIIRGNLNKGNFGRDTAVCISRETGKDPIVDIILLTKGEKVLPEGYIRLDKSVNAGSVSTGRYLAYKRAPAVRDGSGAFEPRLISRYPVQDIKEYPLEARGVSMLCFPRGMILRPTPPLPTFLTLVMTQADAGEVYGAALMFYEVLKLPAEEVKAGAATQFCPKVLCILSHWPFYEGFKLFLNQLYRIAVSRSDIPIERYIGNFMHEIPVPRAMQTVKYIIGHATLTFSRPPLMGLPLKDFSMQPLFKMLSIPNIIALFEHVLSEGKVVMYSNSYEVLTPIAESLRSLLFPFKSQCVFIPILPSNLSIAVRAPVPFIIGLHRSFLDEVQVTDDPALFVVDLDRNAIRPPLVAADEEKFAVLPDHIRTQLRSDLKEFDRLYKDIDISAKDLCLYEAPLETDDEDELDDEVVRLAFMRVMITLLADYRRFILLKEEDSQMLDLETLFDKTGFVNNLPPSLHDFGKQMVQTQLFSDFLLQRVVLCDRSDRLQQVFFFDWCVALSREPHMDDLKVNDGKTSNKDAYQPLRVGRLTVGELEEMAKLRPRMFAAANDLVPPTIHAPKVNAAGVKGPYMYETFPVLNASLIATPRTADTILPPPVPLDRANSWRPPNGTHVSQTSSTSSTSSTSVNGTTIDTSASHSDAINLPSPASAGDSSSAVTSAHVRPFLPFVLPPSALSSSPTSASSTVASLLSTTAASATSGTSSSSASASSPLRVISPFDSDSQSPSSNFSPFVSAQSAPVTSSSSSSSSSSTTSSTSTTSSISSSNGSNTTVASPMSKPRLAPSSREKDRIEEAEALDEANTPEAVAISARQKINALSISLYVQISTLMKRPKPTNEHEVVAMAQVTAIYELWFFMFCSHREKLRRVEAEQRMMMERLGINADDMQPMSSTSASSLSSTPGATSLTVGAAALAHAASHGHIQRRPLRVDTGDSIDDDDDDTDVSRPTSPSPSIDIGQGTMVRSSRKSSAAPSSGNQTPLTTVQDEADWLKQREAEALRDVLAMLVELHGMIQKGGMLPTSAILHDLSLFCARCNLEPECQLVYRLLSTSVPTPPSNLYRTLGTAHAHEFPTPSSSTSGGSIGGSSSSIGGNSSIGIGGASVNSNTSTVGSISTNGGGAGASGMMTGSGMLTNPNERSLSLASNPGAATTPRRHGGLAMPLSPFSPFSAAAGTAGVTLIHSTVLPVGESVAHAMFAGTPTNSQHHTSISSTLSSSSTTSTSINVNAPVNSSPPTSPLSPMSARAATSTILTPAGSTNLHFAFPPTGSPSALSTTSLNVSISGSGSGGGGSGVAPMTPITRGPLFDSDPMDDIVRYFLHHDLDSNTTSSLPDVIDIHALCRRCNYELAGEEIVAGWCDRRRPHTLCPLCTESIRASLHVTLVNHATLQLAVIPPVRLLAIVMAIWKHCRDSLTEFYEIIRRHDVLFWNIFWLSVSRGPFAQGYGQLPYRFLFEMERDNCLVKKELYTVQCDMQVTWRIIRGVVSNTNDEKQYGKNRTSITYLMKHVKFKKVLTSLKEFLRVRHDLQRDRDQDQEGGFFARSAYRQLLLIYLDTHASHMADINEFGREYKASLDALEASVEQAKQQLNKFDMETAQLGTASSPISATSTSTSSTSDRPSSPYPVTLAVSHSSSQSASFRRAATDDDTPLTKGSKGHSSAYYTAEQAEHLSNIKARRAKLVAQVEANQDIRNQLLPCDQCPISSVLDMINTAFKYFGGRMLLSADAESKSTSQGSTSSNGKRKRGSILRDILLNQVPSIEEILSESHQNSIYMLKGFKTFCSELLQPQEIPRDNEKSDMRSLAARYCRLWLAVHKYRQRHDRIKRAPQYRATVSMEPSTGAASATDVKTKLELTDEMFLEACRMYHTFLYTEQLPILPSIIPNTHPCVIPPPGPMPLPSIMMPPLPSFSGTPPSGGSSLSSSPSTPMSSTPPSGSPLISSSLSVGSINSSSSRSATILMPHAPSGTPLSTIPSPLLAAAAAPPPVINESKSAKKSPVIDDEPLRTISGIICKRSLLTRIQTDLRQSVKFDLVDSSGNKTGVIEVHRSAPAALFDIVQRESLTWLERQAYLPWIESIRAGQRAANSASPTSSRRHHRTAASQGGGTPTGLRLAPRPAAIMVTGNVTTVKEESSSRHSSPAVTTLSTSSSSSSPFTMVTGTNGGANTTLIIPTHTSSSVRRMSGTNLVDTPTSGTTTSTIISVTSPNNTTGLPPLHSVTIMPRRASVGGASDNAAPHVAATAAVSAAAALVLALPTSPISQSLLSPPSTTSTSTLSSGDPHHRSPISTSSSSTTPTSHGVSIDTHTPVSGNHINGSHDSGTHHGYVMLTPHPPTTEPPPELPSSHHASPQHPNNSNIPSSSSSSSSTTPIGGHAAASLHRPL